MMSTPIPATVKKGPVELDNFDNDCHGSVQSKNSCHKRRSLSASSDDDSSDLSDPVKSQPEAQGPKIGWVALSAIGAAFVAAIIVALVVTYRRSNGLHRLGADPPTPPTTRHTDSNRFQHSRLFTRQNARQSADVPLLIRWRVNRTNGELVIRLQLNTTAARRTSTAGAAAAGWMALGVGEPTTGGIGGADFAVIENIALTEREAATSAKSVMRERISSATIRDAYTTEHADGAVLHSACESEQNWALLGCYEEGSHEEGEGAASVFCDVSRSLSVGLDAKADRPIRDDGIETMMLFAFGPELATTRIRSPSHAHGHMHMMAAAIPPPAADNARGANSSSSSSEVFEFGVNFFEPQDDAYAQLEKIKRRADTKRMVVDCPVKLSGGGGSPTIALVEITMPRAPALPTNLRLNYLAAEFRFPQYAPHHITQNGVTERGEWKFASFDTSPVILARPTITQSGMPFAQGSKELLVLHFDKAANGTRGQVIMYYTETQVPIESGIVMIGRAWPDAGSPRIPLTTGATNYFTWLLPPSCTRKLRRSVTFFAMQLHVHDQGKGVSVQFGRNGKQYRTIHSEFIEYHKARMLPLAEPVVVMPGDAINVTCKFDIKTPADIGGRAADEMCQAYFSFYPRDAIRGGFDLADGPECPQLYERDPAPFMRHETGFGRC